MQTQQPVNNIYHVPIIEISLMECSEGRPIIGHHLTTTFAEGNTPELARDSLKSYPGYVDNYKNLTLEQKSRITPFKLGKGNIEKVLHCERRFKNSREDYTCGIPVDENMKPDPEGVNGDCGGCCILGYEIPDFLNCPYYNQELINQGKIKPVVEYSI